MPPLKGICIFHWLGDCRSNFKDGRDTGLTSYPKALPHSIK